MRRMGFVDTTWAKLMYHIISPASPALAQAFAARSGDIHVRVPCFSEPLLHKSISRDIIFLSSIQVRNHECFF